MTSLVDRLFIEYSSKLSFLRRVPGLGATVHRVSSRLLPRDRCVWVQVRKGLGRGLWLRLHPRTAETFRDSSLEPALQELLVQHLRPGMVFYDLGANLGFFTLLAARIVGPKGLVFSFEADPEVAQQLRENVEKNGLENVRLIQKAVWSSTGSVTFSRSDQTQSPDRAWGKVLSITTSTRETVEVPSTALDDFIRVAPPPNFVKCDVEGAESEVLAGARRILTTYRPMVACEVHSNGNGEKLRQLFGSLQYSLNWFTPYSFFASPNQVDEVSL